MNNIRARSHFLNKFNRSNVKINNVTLTPVKKELYSKVLTKLYDRLNLVQVRYQMLSDRNQIRELVEVPHYVLYHMHGYNYLIFLTLIDNKPCNFMISKRELKHNQAQNNLDEVKIYTFNINNLRMNYYYDTIFDGKLLRTDGDPIYLIYDCYALCSASMYDISMDQKYEVVSKVLNELNSNINQDNLTLKLMDLMRDADIPDMVFNHLKSSNMKINGLLFLPEKSGKYYIYVNEEEFSRIHTGIPQDEIKKDKPVINNSQFEFVMKKTQLPDVYELYIDTPTGLVREGIAHIPNIKTSHYCQNLFKDKESVKMVCIKSIKFNKWVPLIQDISELSSVIF